MHSRVVISFHFCEVISFLMIVLSPLFLVKERQPNLLLLLSFLILYLVKYKKSFLFLFEAYTFFIIRF